MATKPSQEVSHTLAPSAAWAPAVLSGLFLTVTAAGSTFLFFQNDSDLYVLLL